MRRTASLPTPLSEKSVTPSAAWPPTAASKALPPASRMRRAASVASAFMEATAEWRPRMTGRMVWAESEVWARDWGTSARRTRNATASSDLCDIGFCHLGASVESHLSQRTRKDGPPAVLLVHETKSKAADRS